MTAATAIHGLAQHLGGDEALTVAQSMRLFRPDFYRQARIGAASPVDEREELNMSGAGLSKSRLERMHNVLSGYIERQEMPGLVALVSHHDDVHVETLGTMAFGHPAPMKRDTIFRVAIC